MCSRTVIFLFSSLRALKVWTFVFRRSLFGGYDGLIRAPRIRERFFSTPKTKCVEAALVILATPLIFAQLSCIDCLGAIGHVAAILTVRGRLVDAESQEPLGGAVVGGNSFTSGDRTGSIAPLRSSGVPTLPPSDADGAFALEFARLGDPICEGIRLRPPPPHIEFPRPDEVEVIVVRDGCEQRFLIEVNEDTAVDPEAENGILELRQPILVPACEP